MKKLFSWLFGANTSDCSDPVKDEPKTYKLIISYKNGDYISEHTFTNSKNECEIHRKMIEDINRQLNDNTISTIVVNNDFVIKKEDFIAACHEYN